MNWLFYIGGGIIWYNLWRHLGSKEIDKKKLGITSLLVWIWICWRFIK